MEEISVSSDFSFITIMLVMLVVIFVVGLFLDMLGDRYGRDCEPYTYHQKPRKNWKRRI